mgnify:CR=1 FL=1
MILEDVESFVLLISITWLLLPVFLLIKISYGIKAYQGEYFNIPFVTNLFQGKNV